MLNKYYCSLLFTLLFSVCFGQIVFQKKTKGLPSNTYAIYSIIEGENQDFYAAVGARPNILTHFSKYGDTLWNKKYYCPSSNDSSLITKTFIKSHDKNYFFVVETDILNYPYGYPCILKLDSLGNVIWSKQYSSYAGFLSLVEDIDSSLYLRNRNSIIKINKKGDVIWSKKYSIPNITNNFFFKSIQLFDNGLVILADIDSIYNNTVVSSSSCLFKTDTSGNITWAKKYNHGSWVDPFDLNVINNSSIVFVGRSADSSGGWHDGFVIKTNNSGNVNWVKTYGDTLANNISYIEYDKKQNLTLAGTTATDNSAPKFDMLLIKIDTSGNPIFYKSYGDITKTESTSGIIKNSDKGYLMWGTSGELGSNSYPFMIIKTDSLGNTICNHKNVNFVTSSPNILEKNIIINVVNDTVIDSNIAVGYTSVLAKYDNYCSSVDIEENETKSNKIIVYPNPNGGNFTIKSSFNSDFIIYNELGQIVKKLKLDNFNQNTASIDNFESGVYYIVGQINNKIIAQKLVIIK